MGLFDKFGEMKHQLMHGRKRKTNWDVVKSQDIKDTVRYRDVYEDQQLERTSMGELQTATTRNMASWAIGIAVFLIAFILIGLLMFAFTGLVGASSSGVSNLLTFGMTSSSTSKSETIDVWQYFIPIFGRGGIWQFLISFAFGATAYGIAHALLMRNLKAQNALNDVSDINQHHNDQHIALPIEVMEKFSFFPDTGAHSDVQVSSMISHIALENKGLKRIPFVLRHADDDDDSEFYSAINGHIEDLDVKSAPMIDKKFSAALFEASGVPEQLRKAYDATIIPYNPGNKDRNKMKDCNSVADLINKDWEFPLYETQRPGGAYVVDTEPVNTMVLAITRAGKGQTVIEPTIDMWLREKHPNNIVINDPKGELLVKNYVPAAVRGFQPVQFNLINAMKTDIYNPLILAAQAAREGDTTKCALYVENIAEVFFPLDGGEDPVWPNAANNAFKRAAYGLIDYYMEEERELRAYAERVKMDPATLDTKIDELWGHVTLYNCYQLFVQLTSKKKKNPTIAMQDVQKKCREIENQIKTGELNPNDVVDTDYLEYQNPTLWNKRVRESNAQGDLWDNMPEIDLLTLYFAASDKLPRNSMRTLVANANNALKAMGGADRMLASVYGIAITAMSFFTDPTISTLTSGTPSQNVDLAGLSFPRRFGVQFHPGFVERYHLTGLQVRWQAYKDPEFKESYGEDFYHEDMVSREGWARFYFKGIFPVDTAYLALEVRNAQTGALVKTFHFKFDKGYQKSLDGRRYVTDPVLDDKIIKNGILCELVKNKQGKYVQGHVLFPYEIARLNEDDEVVTSKENIPAIINDMVRYAEKPKVVFLVTPPHLMKYAKLILILIKQLVDLNFDQSYMTKSSQKPLYKTRFMLDELGNLQSEGHGISGFETMLSIGLGQDQFFTIILQTLQQLRDVYGDSIDKIVQGNAQPLSAKIATSNGWKSMGEIEVGDKVLTPDGKETPVQGVYPRGIRPVYKITRADGSSTLACNEHLWNIKIKK